MKATILAILFSSLFTCQAFAECKSVMGSCGTQEAVNAPPHMRSDYVNKTQVTSAPMPTRGNVAATDKTATNNKLNSKKNGDGNLINAIQKKILK